MSSLSLDNRVLLLEERQKNIHEKLDEIMGSHQELMNSHQKMLLELTKYRGLWGGVMLVATAIGIVLSFFKDWLFAHFKS